MIQLMRLKNINLSAALASNDWFALVEVKKRGEGNKLPSEKSP
jgi:hypothetical protein